MAKLAIVEHVIGLGDGDAPVIANALFAVDLLALDDADETGRNGKTWEGGLIHQKENIDRVTVGR